MTISVGTSGGVFVPKFISKALTLASGVTGTIITLTPPAGQRVLLTTLAAVASQTGISVNVGGSVVIATGNLEPTAPSLAGYYCIGMAGTSGASSNSGVFSQIMGGKDEALDVIKDAGNTTQTINYGYMFGVIE